MQSWKVWKDLKCKQWLKFHKNLHPKHESRTIMEWFRSKHIHVLLWSSQIKVTPM